MNDKPKSSAPISSDPPVTRFIVAPAMRCYHHEPNARRMICGELATKRRRGQFWFDDSFFCDQHAQPGDEPIAGDCIFHRFRFNCDIIIAGCSLDPVMAYDEALRRLEAAIASVGGIIDVQQVGKAFGLYSPSPGLGETNGRRGSSR
jgi:hypothetical protein